MSIFHDNELTQGQRLVWFAVRDLAVEGVCYKGPAGIADHMDSARSYVSRALDVLEGAGWVDRVGTREIEVRDTGRDSHTRKRDSHTRKRDSHTRKRDSESQSSEPEIGGGNRGERDSQTRERDSQTRSPQPKSHSPSTFPPFPFSPKKEYHSTPFSQSLPTDTPISKRVDRISDDRLFWGKEVLRKIAWHAEPIPNDHPARWKYHPGDWRFEAGMYALSRLQSHEMLNSHYRKRLINGIHPGKIASEWADTFRLLVEQDGWKKEEVAITMQWLFETENWWRENRVVQSVGALRKKDDEGTTKFDKILQSALADYEQRKSKQVDPEEIRRGWRGDGATENTGGAISSKRDVGGKSFQWAT